MEESIGSSEGQNSMEQDLLEEASRDSEQDASQGPKDESTEVQEKKKRCYLSENTCLNLAAITVILLSQFSGLNALLNM